MPLSLRNIPGFSDVADSELDAGKVARGYTLGKISNNAAFGMVRTELFMGLYHDGDTVILPTSPIDGYPYSREELAYGWMVQSSLNPSTGWITGPDCLWYAAWLVNQADGKVYCEEWYRRSSTSNPNPAKSNDGTLMVFTYATRIKQLALPPATIGDVPDTLGLSNLGCNNGTEFLKVKAATFGSRTFTKAKFRVHSSSTVIPMTIENAIVAKFRAGSTAEIDLISITPVTFDGSPGIALGLGEQKLCDEITLDFDGDHDYYFGVYCTNASNSRCNYTDTSTGDRGNLQAALLAGDATAEPNLSLGLSIFAPGSIWPMFDLLEFSDAFSLSGEFVIIDDGSFYQDRPLNTSLAKTMNANAKLSIFSSEIIHMGEFVDGDQVGNPVSPYDAHVYEYEDVFFMHSWRWTPDGSNFVSPPAGVAGLPSFLQPSKDLGQLDRLNALIDGSGNVAIDVQYKGSGLPASAPGHGRVMVTAFCSRRGFSEVS